MMRRSPSTWAPSAPAPLLFGQQFYQLTITTDGQLFGGDTSTTPPDGRPSWLPGATAGIGPLLAGLWQDINFGSADIPHGGRWHAAILEGYIDGQTLFYAQWHNAPHAANPDLTSRFAIAVTLNDSDSAGGDIFFIYDNISDPDALIAEGYTIGIADRIGQRGSTFAVCAHQG